MSIRQSRWYRVVVADDATWFRRVAVIALFLSASAIFLSAVLYAEERERDAADRAAMIERLDERCTSDEEKERTAVQGMIRTYEFLDALPKEPTDDPVIEFGVRFLPERYREAQANIAPDFCDVIGVGLPEPRDSRGRVLPDPQLPGERDFSYLLPRD